MKPRIESVIRELASYDEAIAAGTPLPVSRILPWPIDPGQKKPSLSQSTLYEEMSTEDYLRLLKAPLQQRFVKWWKKLPWDGQWGWELKSVPQQRSIRARNQLRLKTSHYRGNDTGNCYPSAMEFWHTDSSA